MIIYNGLTFKIDSIGCAQWFAARGQGYLISSPNEKDPLFYESPARVITIIHIFIKYIP